MSRRRWWTRLLDFLLGPPELTTECARFGCTNPVGFDSVVCERCDERDFELAEARRARHG